MSHDDQLKSTKYRNWVKAGLGLKYLGNGLAPFVDNAVKNQHDVMLQDIEKNYGANTRCGHCKLETLMPVHTSGPNNKCPLGHKPSCNCRSPRGKVLCSTRLCSAFYDKLIIQHRYFSPNWKNTDITQWFNNHWQIAKTCIPAGGYEKHTSVTETDCAGLLNVIINNSSIHNLLDTVIDAPNDIFSKTRKARDDIFHSSNFELDDAELDMVLDNMTAILEDKTQIKDMPEAVDAKQKLTQLRSQNFVITMYDEEEIRKNAMDALDEMKQNALDLISEKQRQVLEEIQSSGLQQRTATDEIENRLESTEKTLQSLQDRQTQVETLVANLRGSRLQLIEDVRKIKQELDKIKSDELYSKAKAKHDEFLQHIKEKKALQRDLIRLYRKYYSCVPVHPLMQEREIDVEKTYVKPEMRILRSKNIEQSNSKINITSYKDIFALQGKQHQNIYIIGDAGIGKSAFCKQLISSWCRVHKQNQEQCEFDVLNESTFAEIAMELKTFEFLFFVSLRHCKEENHLHEMIKNQLLQTRRYKDLFDEVIEEEPDKCLVILDGLDEWKNSSKAVVPGRNRMADYTIISTTRPWVLEKHRLKDTEIDISLEMRGVGPSSAEKLATRMIQHLNTVFKRNRLVDSFEREVLLKDLSELKSIPILLQQMVCVWHDLESLGKSQCDIYSSMLNLLIQVAEQNEKLKPVFQLPTSNLLPSCMQDKQECRSHQQLVLSLAKLAFQTLFSNQSDSLLVFPSSQMEVCGMTTREIDECLAVGILTQSEAAGISAVTRYKTIAFIHKTFHEFLAALYIATTCSTTSTEVPREHLEETFSNIYDNCRTFLEILSYSMVFKFLCGMDPLVGKIISKHVDKVVIEQRNESDTFSLSSVHSKSVYATTCGRLMNETNECIQRINAIFLDWIEEAKKNGHENIQLICSEIYDLELYNNVDRSHVKAISFVWSDLSVCLPLHHHGPLTGLHISDCSSFDLMRENIAGLIVLSKETLTTLHLDLSDMTRGHSASNDEQLLLNSLCQVSSLRNVAITNLRCERWTMKSFVSFLLKLKRIKSLYLENVHYTKDGEHFSCIDLSEHEELEHIHTLGCNVRFEIPYQIKLLCADEYAMRNIAPVLSEYSNLNVFSFLPSLGNEPYMSYTFFNCINTISSITLSLPTFKYLKHLQITSVDFGNHDLVLCRDTSHLLTVVFSNILIKDCKLHAFLRTSPGMFECAYNNAEQICDTDLFIRRLKMVFQDERDENRDYFGLQRLSDVTRNLVQRLRDNQSLVILQVLEPYGSKKVKK
ncbi:uncharacterized protein LOC123534832 [Mercenaria mercenaria]|uniref:uncharacterized protein LOC123534832 n=1 Tax=Mercenaria mercenaria TaxID=6596 RepID=UPI00234F6FEF|nr:uncharacterized protein LOC123534832 [Mercenaria mercenaria]